MKRKRMWMTVFSLAMTMMLFGTGSLHCEPNQAAPAAPYTIQSLNTPDPEFVRIGNSVLVKVTGPSTKSLLNASVRLNGQEITGVFAAMELRDL